MTHYEFLRTEKDADAVLAVFNENGIYVNDLEQLEPECAAIAACKTPEIMARRLADSSFIVGLDWYPDALEWVSKEMFAGHI